MLNNSIPKYHTNVNPRFNIVATLNKQPITQWKEFQRRPQTDKERKEQLELLRTKKANAIGFVCGVGGLVNIDIDAIDKDNPEAAAISDDVPRYILAKLGIAWPYAWTWRSASGKGWHIWIVVKDLPEDARREEIPGRGEIVKAIEVRVWGNYSIVPPSVTIPTEPPAVTTWSHLCDTLGITKERNPERAKAKRELTARIMDLLSVLNGDRNNSVYDAAFFMAYHYIAHGLIDENKVKTALYEAAAKRNRNPLPEKETLEAIKSGFDDGKEKATQEKTSQNGKPQKLAELLIPLALDNAEYFIDKTNEAYAKYSFNSYKKVVPFDSQEFRTWLSTLCYENLGKAPGSETINSVINVLFHHALKTGRKEIYSRIAPDGDNGVYINLGDETGRAIHVTPNGWEVVDDPPVMFVRSDTMQALPEPKRGGSLDTLRSFINIEDDESWALIKAWLTMALVYDKPYPILALIGEQGSAKSTTAEFLRKLIDPSYVLVQRPPQDQESLFIIAASEWVVAIDNVSVVPYWLSDALCSLVTGSGITRRRLYSNKRASSIYAKRPIILNGITEFITRGDLLDRVLKIEVPHIPDTKRVDKATLEAEYDKQRPYILGALLDRLSGALREHPHVRLHELPRMADFARFAIAAEKAEVGDSWTYETSLFARSYRLVRDEAKTRAVESHIIGPVLLTWLSAQSLPRTLTAAELLSELEEVANENNSRIIRTHGWPKTPSALSNALRSLENDLRAGYGYDIKFPRSNGKRNIIIDKVHTDASDDTPPDDGNPPPDTPPSRNKPTPPPIGGNPNNTPSGSTTGALSGSDTSATTQQHGRQQEQQEQQQHETHKEEAMRTIKQPASAYYKASQPIVWLETAQDVEDAMRDIMAQPLVGLDFETTTRVVGKKKNGEDAVRPDKLRLVQIATPNNVYILDAFKTDVHLLDGLFTAEEGPVLAGHNLKFELMMMQRTGLPIPSSHRLFDTMIASRLLTAGMRVKVVKKTKKGTEEKEVKLNHGLDDVALRYLHKQVNKELQKSDWSGELTKEQIQYAANDAAIMLPLSDILGEKLYEADLTTVFEIEMRALPAVAWMEETGVFFDVAHWKETAAKNQAALEKLRNELETLAGKKINWNSNKQVLPILKARGVDVDNTQEDTLKPFADKDPLVALFLAYKRLDHLVEHFDKEDMLHAITPDGRLHPNFDQTGTDTGRMACREPNVQQIPRDGEYRKFFRAPHGRVLIKADYSQIELRIAAEYTKDPRMLEAYKTRQDLHTLTAHLVLGVPLEQVDKKHRQKAKALNFGLIYGMGAKGLMNYAATQYNTHWTEEEATTFRDEFFKAYQGLHRWHQRTGQNKYPEAVYTLSGRRRLNVAKYQEKLNTPIQGTGADGLKTALALLWERRHECPSAVPVLAVHDEIVIECDEAEAKKAQKWLEKCMVEGMAWLLEEVPVVVESDIYKNWAGTEKPDNKQDNNK